MFFWIVWAWAFATAAFGADYKVGQKFQIVLSNVVVAPSNPSTKIIPADAEVFDIDMFETEASTIALLQAQGKIVLCYFSAGTYEPYRPDSGQFQASDKGKALPEWPDEYWLKVTSTNVRNIMTARIQLAASKGCNGIDPDNTDAYANPTGNTTVTMAEAIDYIKFLGGIATGLNMTIGLKNSLQILSDVSDTISFAVNEECGFYQECYWYKDFIASKPVYQIEYPTPLPPSASVRTSSCAVNPTQPAGLSLVFKNLSLDGYVSYCDGSSDTTDTKPGDANAPPPRSSKTTVHPHPSTTSSRPTSSKPSQTRSSTTSRPTSSRPPQTTPSYSSRTTSSAMPSSPYPSQTNQPGGCIAKHWDQCGGQNWKGCTVCASGFTCKFSNPYYSQCL
ncbi:uncharacterized protein LY89DRAFT_159243 [Mollisia scopiformis]|uniref:alpha-galactosidase n=1 Tax=Mollisia scopiformis TaxID=149040 RepID=A0A194X0Y3_MOLSC|nr:uncharacterized protein LY89DRAFT_159243 [Mollisia scopiformis]KUJ13522.1 hypothetical protein LY89DRAFT_159243 [Mollisia scopiformis]